MSTNSTTQTETADQIVTMNAVVQQGYGAPEHVLKMDKVERPVIGERRRFDPGTRHQR